MDNLSDPSFQALFSIAFHQRLSVVLRPCFMSYKSAAASVGCNYSTFRTWATGRVRLGVEERKLIGGVADAVHQRVQLAAGVCLIRCGVYGPPEFTEPSGWADRTRRLRHALDRGIFQGPFTDAEVIRLVCLKQKALAEATGIDYRSLRGLTASTRRYASDVPEDLWRLATFLLAWRDLLDRARGWSHWYWTGGGLP